MSPKVIISSAFFLLLMVIEYEETIDDNLPLQFNICYLLIDYMA